MKIRLASRGAFFRLGILFLVLAIVAFWGWSAMFRMPGYSHRGPLPPLTEEERGLAEALRRHVDHLAGEIGERHTRRPKALEAAAAWIEGDLRSAGFEPTREEFEADGVRCRNILALVSGRDPKGEIVVVGAHYDSAPGTRGANDNGTGVAALLEIARALRGATPARTIRLAFFANEEPPHFQTETMGSLVHARAAKARGDRISAMVSLETIGCYRDEKGSQKYPPPIDLLYPDTGNFIAFVGNFSSRALVRQAIDSFRHTAKFPSEGGAPPGFIQGVGWSDHWSFWQVGYRAIMVTDTAPFRYAEYHTSEDTPMRVDYERTARVVAGLRRVILDLAGI